MSGNLGRPSNKTRAKKEGKKKGSDLKPVGATCAPSHCFCLLFHVALDLFFQLERGTVGFVRPLPQFFLLYRYLPRYVNKRKKKKKKKTMTRWGGHPQKDRQPVTHQQQILGFDLFNSGEAKP